MTLTQIRRKYREKENKKKGKIKLTRAVLLLYKAALQQDLIYY